MASDMVNRQAIVRAILEERDKIPSETQHGQSMRGGLRKALRCVETARAVDAVVVNHGKWIHDINNLYGCSECLTREVMPHEKKKKYCPNCGSRMDGGEKNAQTD